MTRRHISSGSKFEAEIGYSRAVVDGDYVFVAGTTGYDYGTMTLPEGVVAQCRQTLANIKAAVGSLDRVARIVMVSGFVNAVDGFSDSPAVINGASDLLVKVFGEAGKHARAAVATNGLPRGTTVEVAVVAEVK